MDEVAGAAERRERQFRGEPPEEPAGLVDVLADLTGVAYFRVDSDRTIVGASRALAELVGRAREDLVGSPCLTVMRCVECLEGCPVGEDEEIRGGRVTLHRQEKEPVEVLHSGRVLRNGRGEVLGFLEVVRPLNGQSPSGWGCDAETPWEETPFVAGLSEEERVEARRIRQALEKSLFRREPAAERLGISRTTLWRKMKMYRML